MKAWAVLLALLVGCVTPYAPSSLRGGRVGYDDVRVADDAYLVSFAGSGYTSDEQALNYAMLRAAEVGLAHGFAFFSVELRRYNGSTTYAGELTTGGVDRRGNVWMESQPTYIYRPGVILGVRFYRERPPSDVTYHDCRKAYLEIGEAYHLDLPPPPADSAVVDQRL